MLGTLVLEQLKPHGGPKYGICFLVRRLKKIEITTYTQLLRLSIYCVHARIRATLPAQRAAQLAARLPIRLLAQLAQQLAAELSDRSWLRSWLRSRPHNLQTGWTCTACLRRAHEKGWQKKK
jgi:hypothetical protein